MQRALPIIPEPKLGVTEEQKARHIYRKNARESRAKHAGRQPPRRRCGLTLARGADHGRKEIRRKAISVLSHPRGLRGEEAGQRK